MPSSCDKRHRPKDMCKRIHVHRDMQGKMDTYSSGSLRVFVRNIHKRRVRPANMRACVHAHAHSQAKEAAMATHRRMGIRTHVRARALEYLRMIMPKYAYRVVLKCRQVFMPTYLLISWPNICAYLRLNIFAHSRLNVHTCLCPNAKMSTHIYAYAHASVHDHTHFFMFRWLRC